MSNVNAIPFSTLIVKYEYGPHFFDTTLLFDVLFDSVLHPGIPIYSFNSFVEFFTLITDTFRTE